MKQYKGQTTVVTIGGRTFRVAIDALPLLIPPRKPSLLDGKSGADLARAVNAINTAGSYEEAKEMCK